MLGDLLTTLGPFSTGRVSSHRNRHSFQVCGCLSWLQGLNSTILWGLKYHLVYTHGISHSFASDQKTLFMAQKVGEWAHEPGAH